MLPPAVWLSYAPKWLHSTPEDVSHIWANLSDDTRRRVGYHLRQLEHTRPLTRTRRWVLERMFFGSGFCPPALIAAIEQAVEHGSLARETGTMLEERILSMADRNGEWNRLPA